MTGVISVLYIYFYISSSNSPFEVASPDSKQMRKLRLNHTAGGGGSSAVGHKACVLCSPASWLLRKEIEANQGTIASPLPPVLLATPCPPAEVLLLNRELFCLSLLPLNVDVLGH